jgi:hypothetical protein
MRLTRRVISLEKRAASGTGCTLCRGEGWPTVLIAGAPLEARPENWPVGCRACGKVDFEMTTWLGLGPQPTAAAACALLEAI